MRFSAYVTALTWAPNNRYVLGGGPRTTFTAHLTPEPPTYPSFDVGVEADVTVEDTPENRALFALGKRVKVEISDSQDNQGAKACSTTDSI